MQGTASMYPGNSGGGVFVNHGGWKLAGLAELVWSWGVGAGFARVPMLASTVSYFVSMKNIRLFLEGV
jgi:hypothetical protein